MTIHCNKWCECGPSPSFKISYCAVLTLLLVMIKHLRDEMQWGEGHGHCDTVNVATDLLRICHKEGHLLPDVSWLWVTEMMERETSDKSRLPYKYKVKIRQCLLLLIKVLLRWHWKFFTSCFVPFRPRCKPFPFISMLSHFFLPKLPQGLQIRLPLPRSTSQQTWEGI